MSKTNIEKFLGSICGASNTKLHFESVPAGPSHIEVFASKQWVASVDELIGNEVLDAEMRLANHVQNIHFRPNSSEPSASGLETCRTYFVDFRFNSKEEKKAVLENIPLPPSFIVGSNRLAQGYWLPKSPIPTESWVNVQAVIAHCSGTEVGSLDPLRAMRLPGFHDVSWSEDGFQHDEIVIEVSEPSLRYSIDEILDAFEGADPVQPSNGIGLRDVGFFTSFQMDFCDLKVTGSKRTEALKARILSWMNCVLSRGTIMDALVSENMSICDPPLTMDELEAIIRSVYLHRRGN